MLHLLSPATCGISFFVSSPVPFSLLVPIFLLVPVSPFVPISPLVPIQKEHLQFYIKYSTCLSTSKPNGFFHLYLVGKSINNLRGVR